MDTETIKMEDFNNTGSTSAWHFLFYELSDKRTIDWPLMKDPTIAGSILIAYLYFVLSAGPRFMAKRKPFQLTNILIVYNFLQVCLSVYLVYEGLEAGWLRDYNWNCEPVDFSRSPKAMRVANACYIYFLAKMTELLDTVFFVLRKKDKQVTFLHMYHHTGMPMIAWGVTKYFPGGHGTLIGVINSFVHVIMYSYYMLAAWPGLQKYLWWKKYITTLQLVRRGLDITLQFCLAFLHSAQLLWFDCGYPKFSLYFTMPNSIFFYLLFNDFYKKAYGSKDRAKGDKKLTEKSNDITQNDETKKQS